MACCVLLNVTCCGGGRAAGWAMRTDRPIALDVNPLDPQAAATAQSLEGARSRGDVAHCCWSLVVGPGGHKERKAMCSCCAVLQAGGGELSPCVVDGSLCGVSCAWPAAGAGCEARRQCGVAAVGW